MAQINPIPPTIIGPGVKVASYQFNMSGGQTTASINIADPAGVRAAILNPLTTNDTTAYVSNAVDSSTGQLTLSSGAVTIVRTGTVSQYFQLVTLG